jgi:hypothetical protein
MNMEKRLRSVWIETGREEKKKRMGKKEEQII